MGLSWLRAWTSRGHFCCTYKQKVTQGKLGVTHHGKALPWDAWMCQGDIPGASSPCPFSPVVAVPAT